MRSDLPRLEAEGFFLFALLEPVEQTLAEPAKWQLLAEAFAALVAHEERNSERPLPAVLPRERRNRAGQVLGLTRHLKAQVRLFKGAFAYFTPDDLRPLEALETEGFTGLACSRRHTGARNCCTRFTAAHPPG